MKKDVLNEKEILKGFLKKMIQDGFAEAWIGERAADLMDVLSDPNLMEEK